MQAGITAWAVVAEDNREHTGKPAVPKHQKSREGTVPITVMLPEDVRMQLKILAIEKRDTIRKSCCGSAERPFQGSMANPVRVFSSRIGCRRKFP